MNIDWEKEYNNRARVPEHPEIITGWQESAAAFRDRTACELDIAYGPQERNKLDLFMPPDIDADADDTPLHMFIHGGYWQALDKDHFSHVAAGLTQRGRIVAIPSYSLCPDIDLPGIVSEMWTCVTYLCRRFSRSMTVSGHSAGGHLVAELLATDWTQIADGLPDMPITKGVAVSGLFDLRPLCRTSVNDKLGLDDTRAMAASPAFKIPRPGISMLTAVGEFESSEFHRQSAVIADAWKPHGIDVEHMIMPDTNHFTVLDPYADKDSALVSACL